MNASIPSPLRGMLAACCLSLAGLGVVNAQSTEAPDKPGGYPSRDITVMIPFGPGGGSDQMMRALGAEMSRIMGVDFRYTNKPGAGGLAAIPDFLVAPTDGYTLLQHHDAVVTGQAAGKHRLVIGENIVPICIPQQDFSQLFINAEDDRFSDWESLVEYARDSGETLRVAASSGQGSHEHSMVTLIAEGSGIDLEVVPFGDPGERVSAILGQHLALYYDQPGEARPYVQEGQLTPVLSIVEEAPDAFSDIPDLRDVGLEFNPTLKFRALWASPEVPEERRDYLEAVCRQAAESEGFQAYLKRTYTHLNSRFYGSEEGTEFAQQMLETYRTTFRNLGIID